MGQKVNPHGMRVGVIKDWDSRWYARDEKVGDLIVEDNKIRKFVKKSLYGAGVPKIEIERSNDVVTLFVHCARPGMVIGKDGAEAPRASNAAAPVVSAAARSLALSTITRAPSPCRPSVLTSSTASPRLRPRLAASV